MILPVLELPCEKCSVYDSERCESRPVVNAPCEECNGIGWVLTPEGKRVVEAVSHHLDSVIASCRE